MIEIEMVEIENPLLTQALCRRSDVRAASAASPVESLDATVDPHAEAQWAIEIRRRIVALDSGAPTTPWADLRNRIAEG